jgi:predicted GNAT superfamily acetyltransferase
VSAGWSLVDATTPGWPTLVDELYAPFDPATQQLVPAYFVKTAFVKLGGRVLALREHGAVRALGLLFPRACEGGRPVYTLRLQEHGPALANSEVLRAAEALLAPGRVLLHRPGDTLAFAPTHAQLGPFDIGAPSADELLALRRLRGAIWGLRDEEGYPDDLFSVEFGLGTALVARQDAQLVGFLFGFRRFGLPPLEKLGLPYRFDLGLESQVMGVDPAVRRGGLAATLKREQARQALAAGLDFVHWTADPLQFPNAVLNFAKLRAVAGEFTRALYPVTNALNRTPASRLGLTWLPRSARGAAGLRETPRGIGGLERFPGIVQLNDGPNLLAEPHGAPHIAIAIPADWTALQRDDPALAAAWRAASDDLLEAAIGYSPDRYLVGDVAVAGDRRFLVGHAFTQGVLEP